MVCKYSVCGCESLVVIRETDIQETVQCILGSRHAAGKPVFGYLKRLQMGLSFLHASTLFFLNPRGCTVFHKHLDIAHCLSYF